MGVSGLMWVRVGGLGIEEDRPRVLLSTVSDNAPKTLKRTGSRSSCRVDGEDVQAKTLAVLVG